ncbi:MAG: hypothetical protein KDA17_08075 [Candidatus Saccharibacteria bacterium]|nr:hypothetical protein [Candidatus Saccharibacteria bacterium]
MVFYSEGMSARIEPEDVFFIGDGSIAKFGPDGSGGLNYFNHVHRGVTLEKKEMLYEAPDAAKAYLAACEVIRRRVRGFSRVRATWFGETEQLYLFTMQIDFAPGETGTKDEFRLEVTKSDHSKITLA